MVWARAGRAGLKAALPAILCAGLAGCGVSQLTEPLQSGIFGSSEDDQPQAQAPANEGAETSLAAMAQADQSGNGDLVTGSVGKITCPLLSVAAQGRTVTFHAPGAAVDDRLTVMHRGEITKTARECVSTTNALTIKYGFSGRVLLGPKGQPGSITLPAKVTVESDSGPVKTENVQVVVNVPAGSTRGTFSEVRQVEVPIVPGAKYRLNVGFDKGASGAS